MYHTLPLKRVRRASDIFAADKSAFAGVWLELLQLFRIGASRTGDCNDDYRR